MARGYLSEDRPASFRDDSEGVARFEGVTGVAATKIAVLVRLATGFQYWVPQSVIHDDSEVFAAGQKGALIVKAWFAQKQGMQ
jgi:hypothetical protein